MRGEMRCAIWNVFRGEPLGRLQQINGFNTSTDPIFEMDRQQQHDKRVMRVSDSKAPDTTVIISKLESERDLGASFSFILERTGQPTQGMLETRLVSPYQMSPLGYTHVSVTDYSEVCQLYEAVRLKLEVARLSDEHVSRVNMACLSSLKAKCNKNSGISNCMYSVSQLMRFYLMTLALIRAPTTICGQCIGLRLYVWPHRCSTSDTIEDWTTIFQISPLRVTDGLAPSGTYSESQCEYSNFETQKACFPRLQTVRLDRRLFWKFIGSIPIWYSKRPENYEDHGTGPGIFFGGLELPKNPLEWKQNRKEHGSPLQGEPTLKGGPAGPSRVGTPARTRWAGPPIRACKSSPGAPF
ncbi:hypothetical protein JCGZ_04211 [Jatropha curcas]|uniref:Uncharacterized protein n=1 Tax=Jatropha curcas TaxID=180498 RepID=A0A067JM65_JATCU|nr:hypothetical protein JCGZ_04211 [Jatropha curcas]